MDKRRNFTEAYYQRPDGEQTNYSLAAYPSNAYPSNAYPPNAYPSNAYSSNNYPSNVDQPASYQPAQTYEADYYSEAATSLREGHLSAPATRMPAQPELNYVQQTGNSVRRPLIRSLYNQRISQAEPYFSAEEPQAAFYGAAQGQQFYTDVPQAEFSAEDMPERPTRSAKKRKRVGLFSLLSLVVLSLAALLLYRSLLSKPVAKNDEFSLFSPKHKQNTLPTALPATDAANVAASQANSDSQIAQDTSQTLSPNNAQPEQTLAAIRPEQAEAEVGDIFRRGGNESFQGAIKLTAAQVARMINLNLEPDETNMRINLSILGENDPRVGELVKSEARLAPNMIRLAAKNEAFDFVYKYLQLPASAPERNADAVSQTGASSLGDYKLPAGKLLALPYYLQWDERWGYKPYAGSVIGTYGCGVTCMASVLGYLTNDATILPDKLALLSTASNTNHGGTDTAFIPLAAEKYGCQAVGIPILASNFKAAIDSNNVVVLNVGAGNFTSGGHYVAIVGYTQSGDFIVYDPVSPFHTSQIWSIELLQKQNAQACWSIGK